MFNHGGVPKGTDTSVETASAGTGVGGCLTRDTETGRRLSRGTIEPIIRVFAILEWFPGGLEREATLEKR